MPTLTATFAVGALRAAPALDGQSAAPDVRERAPAGVPVGETFADADLDGAYAVLAARFPDETFSRAFVIGSVGTRTLQAGLVALVAAIILIVAQNFS
jgi:hypothetical protein